MKNLSLLFALALSGFAACDGTEDKLAPHEAMLGDTTEISVGQTVTFLPDGFELRLDTVLSDGRCPTNSTCVFEGLVDAQLHFRLGSAEQTDTMQVRGIGWPGFPPDSTTFSGYRVRLFNVSPYPVNDFDEIEPDDYKIHVVVDQL